MDVTARTLRRRLKEQRFPPAHHLIRLGRLLEGVALREMGIGSRGRIASVLKLGGADDLRRLVRDLTGLSLEDLLTAGTEGEIIRLVVDRVLA